MKPSFELPSKDGHYFQRYPGPHCMGWGMVKVWKFEDEWFVGDCNDETCCPLRRDEGAEWLGPIIPEDLIK